MTDDVQRHALERASAIRSLIQGEILDARDLCVILADAQWPLSDLAASCASATQTTEGTIIVPEPVDVAVLLTQTCDLQDTSHEARLCQLAPVVTGRGETFAREVQRGRRPGWVAVPWYPAHPDGVVDLSRITSAERSLVIDVPSLGRPRTEQERLHFAETISRHFTRVALPDPVCQVLEPFLVRIKERHDRQSEEGRCIALIASLRVEATPDMDAPAPALRLLVVLETSDLPPLPGDADVDNARIDELVSRGYVEAAKVAINATDPVVRREGWTALVELWAKDAVARASTTPEVDGLDVEVISGHELSFARARNAPELDLVYLTTRAA